MNSQSDFTPMKPTERGDYGFARVRNAAFDAVRALWERRKSEGVSQQMLADRLGKDSAWVSKNLRGPGNWTMKIFGQLIEALDGEVEIKVHALGEKLSWQAIHQDYLGEDREVAQAPPAQILSYEIAPAARKSFLILQNTNPNFHSPSLLQRSPEIVSAVANVSPMRLRDRPHV